MRRSFGVPTILFILLLTLTPAVFAQGLLGPVGPGAGTFEDDHIVGQFADWDREATPTLVLRTFGAGGLRVFADIDLEGHFDLVLPAISADTPLGARTCGDPSKGPIATAGDFDLLTTLEGFTTPNRADRGLSVIGMALYADEAFSQDVGAPGGKRAQWLFSRAARTIAVGECNNANSFTVAIGWNAVTVISGPAGGPHTFRIGLDEELAWYWFAFEEPTPE